MTDATRPAGDPRDNQGVLLQLLKGQHADQVLRAPCRRCGAEAPHAVAGYRQRGGRIAARGWCEACERWITGDIAIPTQYRTTQWLVVLQDNSDDSYQSRCERCDKVGPVELHHWAPVSLFPDAWDWPMSELCPDCHRRWHRVTGVATGQPREEAA